MLKESYQDGSGLGIYDSEKPISSEFRDLDNQTKAALKIEFGVGNVLPMDLLEDVGTFESPIYRKISVAFFLGENFLIQETGGESPSKQKLLREKEAVRLREKTKIPGLDLITLPSELLKQSINEFKHVTGINPLGQVGGYPCVLTLDGKFLSSIDGQLRIDKRRPEDASANMYTIRIAAVKKS